MGTINTKQFSEVNIMIKRDLYLSKIKAFYESELIKVIIGIRRCGKSVLLRQIIQELSETGIDGQHIIYLNFEDLEHASLLDAVSLHSYIKQQIYDDKKHYLFFDEVQSVDQFEKALNSFQATMNVSIFITGSNSKLLSGELATLLSGRYVSFRIMPFCFKEMCKIKNLNHELIKEETLMEYITWGGMPQRFSFHTDQEYKIFLTDLYNSIVLRDIIQRGNIKDVDILNRIMEYMVSNPSQTFSAASISKYFESVNRKISMDTLYHYLEQIQAAMIMTKSMRYDIRGKKILTRMDKYYLADPGLGKIKNSGFKTDIGFLLKNVIYNELLVRDYDVYTGKVKNGEIDFVAIKDNQKEYYQIAYLLASEDVINREFNVYENVSDNYPKYVLSMDRFDFSRDGIIHKNILDFLLE